MQKKVSILFILVLFILNLIFFIPNADTLKVSNVYSPTKVEFSNKQVFQLPSSYASFDSFYSDKNKSLAKNLGITEDEAFILGNLAKNWSTDLLVDREVNLENNDILYSHRSYLEKFKYSGFCLYNSKPYTQEGFQYRLNKARKGKFVVIDLETDKIYKIGDNNIKNLHNYLLIKASHIKMPKKYYHKKNFYGFKEEHKFNFKTPKMIYQKGIFKIILSDFTTHLKPNRNCDSMMCREVLNHINATKNTMDIAIYGYSDIPAIDSAIKNALSRGVKIRLICDSDKKGGNIYEDTPLLQKLIINNVTDKFSPDVNSIMHNKFIIFDNRIVITGSTNLSHTDMSDFNSNVLVVINAPTVAKIYEEEFEQMYNKHFHTEKQKVIKNYDIKNLKISFSPEDKSSTNIVIPIINNAKKYIYIPIFVLTDRKITDALIQAKSRGVTILVLADALNTTNKSSKIKELRSNGIWVKTENYAGKMHSKSMIVDDKYTIIGSMNFSYSGENKNDENLICIEDENIAKFYKKFFLYQWNKIDKKYSYYNVRAEGKESIGSCSDGIDNNYDGLIDKDDPACRG